jgi:RNase H-like domain found in reverse transcriptase
LHGLVCNDVRKLVWSELSLSNFCRLKEAFCDVLLLGIPPSGASFAVKTDASIYAAVAVLSVSLEEGMSCPVSFVSQVLTAAEKNYTTYKKELLAIVCAFKQWRHYLQDSVTPFVVYTDHGNLEALSRMTVLSQHLAHGGFSCLHLFSSCLIIERSLTVRLICSLDFLQFPICP